LDRYRVLPTALDPRLSDQLVQQLRDLTARELACTLTGDHDQIESIRQGFPLVPKPLANTAFYTVANHRVAHPLADRDAQPSPRRMLPLSRWLSGSRVGLLRGQNDHKAAENPTLSDFDHAFEILRAQDAVRSPETARF